MKSINKITIMAIILLITNGCSGLINNTKSRHFTSKVNLNDYKLNQSLAKDMIEFIQNYYPNSKTTFYFQLDKSAYDQGAVIEDALRNVGYGVSYIKKRNRIPFAYKIDFITKDIIRTTYHIGSATLSRLYRVNGKEVNAASAFTTRGFKKSLYRSHTKNKYITSSKADYRKAIVTIATLRIRDKPSTQGNILGKYHKDALIFVEPSEINALGEEWSRVIQRDSQGEAIYSKLSVEYVASKYLDFLN